MYSHSAGKGASCSNIHAFRLKYIYRNTYCYILFLSIVPQCIPVHRRNHKNHRRQRIDIVHNKRIEEMKQLVQTWVKLLVDWKVDSLVLSLVVMRACLSADLLADEWG